MPRSALNNPWGRWTNAVETQLVDHDTNVATLRHEPMTPGYALVNLRSALYAGNHPDRPRDHQSVQQTILLASGRHRLRRLCAERLPPARRAFGAQGRSFNAGGHRDLLMSLARIHRFGEPQGGSSLLGVAPSSASIEKMPAKDGGRAQKSSPVEDLLYRPVAPCPCRGP